MAAAMAARSMGLANVPVSVTCRASKVAGGETRTREPLLLRLTNYLGWNLDDVGAANTQIEPLVVDRTMRANLDRVDKRPALPAGFVGRQRKQCRC